jgi:hypothetical protein
MQRRTWLALLLIALLLAGCAQGMAGQAATPNAPIRQGTTGLDPSTAAEMVAAGMAVCSWRGSPSGGNWGGTRQSQG